MAVLCGPTFTPSPSPPFSICQLQSAHYEATLSNGRSPPTQTNSNISLSRIRCSMDASTVCSRTTGTLCATWAIFLVFIVTLNTYLLHTQTIIVTFLLYIVGVRCETVLLWKVTTCVLLLLFCPCKGRWFAWFGSVVFQLWNYWQWTADLFKLLKMMRCGRQIEGPSPSSLLGDTREPQAYQLGYPVWFPDPERLLHFGQPLTLITMS